MVHPGQQSGLALKLLSQAFIREQGFLQRHGRIEPFIHRFVDRAHAALSKQTNNPITTL
jgi:hypothetical protein